MSKRVFLFGLPPCISLWVLIFWLCALIGLVGCEDKAAPLDCPNACGHRLD